MSVSNHIIVLKKFPLFATFEKEHLQLIAFNLEKVHLKKGDILFQEQDAADCAYIITSGKIELSHFAQNNKDVLTFVQTNQMFDETALIVENLTRKNTARAVEETQLLKISQTLFKRFLVEFPEFVPILYDYYKTRFQKTEALISHFSASF